jgi:hypothetical protein
VEVGGIHQLVFQKKKVVETQAQSVRKLDLSGSGPDSPEELRGPGTSGSMKGGE